MNKIRNFAITPENSIYGTGKRKEAIARVWLVKDKPEARIVKAKGSNKEWNVQDYFQRESLINKVVFPLKITGLDEKFGIYATVVGGGVSAQAEAVMYGVAKALLKYNPELRTQLKKAGLLVRDAREKERKKYAQMGARAKYRWSKR